MDQHNWVSRTDVVHGEFVPVADLEHASHVFTSNLHCQSSVVFDLASENAQTSEPACLVSIR